MSSTQPRHWKSEVYSRDPGENPGGSAATGLAKQVTNASKCNFIESAS